MHRVFFFFFVGWNIHSCDLQNDNNTYITCRYFHSLGCIFFIGLQSYKYLQLCIKSTNIKKIFKTLLAQRGNPEKSVFAGSYQTNGCIASVLFLFTSWGRSPFYHHHLIAKKLLPQQCSLLASSIGHWAGWEKCTLFDALNTFNALFFLSIKKIYKITVHLRAHLTVKGTTYTENWNAKKQKQPIPCYLPFLILNLAKCSKCL